MKTTSSILFLAANLAFVGTAIATPPASPTSTAWVKLDLESISDANSVTVNADHFIIERATCADSINSKLESTPFDSKGSLIISVVNWSTHCAADIEIPFSTQNGELVTPTTSYTVKSDGCFESGQSKAYTFVVSPLNAGFNGYLIKAIESK